MERYHICLAVVNGVLADLLCIGVVHCIIISPTAAVASGIMMMMGNADEGLEVRVQVALSQIDAMLALLEEEEEEEEEEEDHHHHTLAGCARVTRALFARLLLLQAKEGERTTMQMGIKQMRQL